MLNSGIKGVVFDMDGVLRIGNEPIEGVNDVFNWLKEQKIPYMISTNECRYSPSELYDDLSEMGIVMNSSIPIYTAGLAAKDYLRSKLSRFPKEIFNIGVVGESGLYQVLHELTSFDNCQFMEVPPQPTDGRLYLVIGTVDKIKISTLEKTRQWVQAGAKIITTCCDMSDPSSKGDFSLGMPNHMLHMVSYNNAIQHTKAYSTGKPNPIHKKAILKQFNSLKPEEILFIGDTLYTDIRLAEESGFMSALVLSGNTNKDVAKGAVVESDYVLESIKNIKDLF